MDDTGRLPIQYVHTHSFQPGCYNKQIFKHSVKSVDHLNPVGGSIYIVIIVCTRNKTGWGDSKLLMVSFFSPPLVRSISYIYIYIWHRYLSSMGWWIRDPSSRPNQLIDRASVRPPRTTLCPTRLGPSRSARSHTPAIELRAASRPCAPTTELPRVL
jgi:hypothetical protein